MNSEPKHKFTFSIGQLIAVMMLVGILIGIGFSLNDTYAHSTSGPFMWPTRTFGRPSGILFGGYWVVLAVAIGSAIFCSRLKDKLAVSLVLFLFFLLPNLSALSARNSYLVTMDEALNRSIFTIIVLIQIVGVTVCETMIMNRSRWNYVATVCCIVAIVAFWLIGNELVMRF